MTLGERTGAVLLSGPPALQVEEPPAASRGLAWAARCGVATPIRIVASAPRLAEPNGTVTYTYNADSTLEKKTDAKNQRLEYTYDAYKRLTQIRKFNSAGQEDAAARVDFTYDQNPFDGSYTLNSWGRRSTAHYHHSEFGFTGMYSYTAGGRPAKKKLQLIREGTGQTLELEGAWAYDDEGRMTSVTYPLNGGTYSYGYDSLGRPNGLLQGSTPLVSAVTYGPAGELTGMVWGYGGYVFGETRSYNARMQLTRLTATGVDLEYRYSATQNNGQITQMKDWVSGEEVSYTYDSLSRLSAAWTTGPEWGQSYGYDGFGNRVSVTVTTGTAPGGSLTIDPANNRITNPGFSYDANGNLWAMPGMVIGYDYDNRVAGVGSESYGYDPENRWVYNITASEVYFWGVDGSKLGTYKLNWTPLSLQTLHENLHFAGRLIKSQGKWVATDRLGSVVKSESETLRYFPWGEERVTSPQGRPKFGTYHRDSNGLDYALNRHYSSSHGRFLSPDPYDDSAAPADPQTWNRYTYVVNDPVNDYDPTGLVRCGDLQIPELNGMTVQQAILSNGNLGLLARVVFAEAPPIGEARSWIIPGVGAVTIPGAYFLTLEQLTIASALVNRYDMVNRNTVVTNAAGKTLESSSDIGQLGFGPEGASFREVVIRAVGGHTLAPDGTLLPAYQGDLMISLNSDTEVGPRSSFDGTTVNSNCYRAISAVVSAFIVLTRQFIAHGVTSWNKAPDNERNPGPDPRNLVRYGRINPGVGNTYYGVIAGRYVFGRIRPLPLF